MTSAVTSAALIPAQAGVFYLNKTPCRLFVFALFVFALVCRVWGTISAKERVQMKTLRQEMARLSDCHMEQLMDVLLLKALEAARQNRAEIHRATGCKGRRANLLKRTGILGL